MAVETVRRSNLLFLVLERLLMLVGLAALGYTLGTYGGAMLYQDYESAQLDAILRSGATRSAQPAAPQWVKGQVLGRIEVPSLGISTIIKNGEDARTLQLAVGHIAGTAFPGYTGNVGLAGHRDTFFRRLRDVAPGDLIRLVTPGGTFAYVVERTHVVQPEDVWVLDPTPEPALTLVTCFPFTYIGTAPQRFIVRARLQREPVATPAAYGRRL